MKNTILIFTITYALFSASAQAQTSSSGLYPLLLSGVYYTTNAAGKIQTQTFTQQTLLKEKVVAAGVSDKGMAVVYHVNGNELGDTIDIIDTKTGTVLDTLLGLYFGQAFARVGLTNSTDTEERVIQYVYTDQDAHSMGAATIRKTYTGVGTGSSGPRIQITGHLDYVRRPDGSNGIRLYSGNFRTGPAYQFK